MLFNPENPVNKLCAQGMQAEGEGRPEDAARFFAQAWDEAGTPFEKFTAAHYVARQQGSAADKLKWDLIALEFAMEINDPEIRPVYPSLFLNVAKGFEDVEEKDKARDNYERALEYVGYLPADGYGEMIKAGIKNGIDRIAKHG